MPGCEEYHMIPLYKLPKDFEWEELIQSETAHPGLIFDKFPNGWTWVNGENDQQKLTLPEGDNGAKEKLYSEAAKRSTDKQSKEYLETGLNLAIDRQKKLTESQSGLTLTLQTDWRLITGVGNSHPYETGFIWHRTLGVPYLSGSSIKGILRDWITHWTEEGEREANRLLGANEIKDNENDKQPASVGAVIIFDALPTLPPKLEVDILNPHYQPYYSDPATVPPADYYNPVPVKFLTIAPGQVFLFSIAPRISLASSARGDVDKCIAYLLDALATLGAGGKTAVGYGVLTESVEVARKRQVKRDKEVAIEIKQKEKILAEKAAIESGLPEELMPMIAILNEEKWGVNHAKFYIGAEHWIPIIKKQEKRTQMKAAQILADILDNFYNGIIADPNKKRGKKNDKPFYKNPKAVSIANELKTIFENGK